MEKKTKDSLNLVATCGHWLLPPVSMAAVECFQTANTCTLPPEMSWWITTVTRQITPTSFVHLFADSILSIDEELEALSRVPHGSHEHDARPVRLLHAPVATEHPPVLYKDPGTALCAFAACVAGKHPPSKILRMPWLAAQSWPTISTSTSASASISKAGPLSCANPGLLPFAGPAHGNLPPDATLKMVLQGPHAGAIYFPVQIKEDKHTLVPGYVYILSSSFASFMEHFAEDGCPIIHV